MIDSCYDTHFIYKDVDGVIILLALPKGFLNRNDEHCYSQHKDHGGSGQNNLTCLFSNYVAQAVAIGCL